jgi:ribonuclease VapC
MVLDTSAIVATISGEPDGSRFQEALLRGPSLAISAVTALESRIVLLSRHGVEAVREFDDMLEHAGITVIPFDAGMAIAAFEAFQKFGKGQGHPAQLNIIDCAAYALAKIRGEPPLFKGSDFGKTDIKPAL